MYGPIYGYKVFRPHTSPDWQWRCLEAISLVLFFRVMWPKPLGWGPTTSWGLGNKSRGGTLPTVKSERHLTANIQTMRLKNITDIRRGLKLLRYIEDEATWSRFFVFPFKNFVAGLSLWLWVRSWSQDCVHLCGQREAKAKNRVVQGWKGALWS